jgi:hypothetical protein
MNLHNLKTFSLAGPDAARLFSKSGFQVPRADYIRYFLSLS